MWVHTRSRRLTSVGKREQFQQASGGPTKGMKRTSHHEVRPSKVRKAGSANLAFVRSVRAIRDEVHTHLALRCLNGAVRLARGNGVALAEEL